MDLVHSGPGCKCSHHLSKRSLIDIHSVLGDSGLYHGFGEDFPEPTKPLTSFSHHFPTFSSHLPVAPKVPRAPRWFRQGTGKARRSTALAAATSFAKPRSSRESCGRGREALAVGEIKKGFILVMSPVVM